MIQVKKEQAALKSCFLCKARGKYGDSKISEAVSTECLTVLKPAIESPGVHTSIDRITMTNFVLKEAFLSAEVFLSIKTVMSRYPASSNSKQVIFSKNAL